MEQSDSSVDENEQSDKDPNTSEVHESDGIVFSNGVNFFTPPGILSSVTRFTTGHWKNHLQHLSYKGRIQLQSSLHFADDRDNDTSDLPTHFPYNVHFQPLL